MALFAHHPARVEALRSAAHDTDAAVRQTRRFIDDIRGTSLAVPRAVEGTRLVDAGRRPLRNLDRRAERLVPAYELQSKAARLWADMVEDFNWRVDQLNEIWDQAHPSRWQQATAAALGSPLLGALASDDEADEMLTDLRRQLVARHAALETRLDAVGDQIAATLDAGPGPAVDSYYRFMDDALASARRERRKAEELLATFRDRPWSQKIRDEIGAGAVSAILGLADSVITISPFGSDDPRFRDVPKISPDHMPSDWWERVLRERGLDTRGPTFNLAELSTIVALSAAPGAGPARSALTASRVGSAADDPILSLLPVLRAAGRQKGNYSLGTGSSYDAWVTGFAWVGDGYKMSSDGSAFVSADGLRQFRPPTLKKHSGLVQANLQERDIPSGPWSKSNGHLTVKDPL